MLNLFWIFVFYSTIQNVAGQPILKNPPVLEPLIGGVRVRIEDTTTDRSSKNIERVLLQYKVANASIWHNSETILWSISKNATINVMGLSAFTFYKFRAILLDAAGEGYIEEDVPYRRIKTLCQLVDDKDIFVTSQYNSITVDWKLNVLSCPPNVYGIHVLNYVTISKLPFTVYGLDPLRRYSVSIYHSVTLLSNKEVYTKPDRPAKLRNGPIVQSTSVDGAVINVDQTVDRISHNIKKYIVQYKIANESTWNNSSLSNTWPPSTPLTLLGLNSNTQYDIRVILVENNGNAFYGNDKDAIPELSFKTSCNLVDSEDVKYYTDYDSITVNWETNTTSCPSNMYTLYYSKHYTRKIRQSNNNIITSLPFTIHGLQPETTYYVAVIPKTSTIISAIHQVTTKKDRGPKLLYAPTIYKTLVDGAKIEISSQADRDTRDVTSVLLQYKTSLSDTWHNDTRGIRWIVSSPLELQGLKRNTKYIVRAILVEQNGDAFYGNEKDRIPELSFTTLCDVVEKSDVEVDRTGTSITVSWKIHSSSCSPTYYTYSLFNNNYKFSDALSHIPLTLSGLDSSQEYSFRLYTASNNLEILNISIPVQESSKVAVIVTSSIISILIFICSIILIIYYLYVVRKNRNKNRKIIKYHKRNSEIEMEENIYEVINEHLIVPGPSQDADDYDDVESINKGATEKMHKGLQNTTENEYDKLKHEIDGVLEKNKFKVKPGMDKNISDEKLGKENFISKVAGPYMVMNGKKNISEIEKNLLKNETEKVNNVGQYVEMNAPKDIPGILKNVRKERLNKNESQEEMENNVLKSGPYMLMDRSKETPVLEKNKTKRDQGKREIIPNEKLDFGNNESQKRRGMEKDGGSDCEPAEMEKEAKFIENDVLYSVVTKPSNYLEILADTQNT